MRKSEAEPAIRQLISQWARERGIRRGQDEMPSYDEFRAWVRAKGYGHYLEFRSTMGAYDDAERWFDEELGQSWRN